MNHIYLFRTIFFEYKYESDIILEFELWTLLNFRIKNLLRNRLRESWIVFFLTNLMQILKRYRFCFMIIRKNNLNLIHNSAKLSSNKLSVSNNRNSLFNKLITSWRKLNSIQINLMNCGIKDLSFMISWKMCWLCKHFKIMWEKLLNNCLTLLIWRVKCKT